MIIGYGRTSTFDQAAGLAAQERELKAAGATKMFTEQVSSVAQRVRLAECLAFLREDDYPGIPSKRFLVSDGSCVHGCALAQKISMAGLKFSGSSSEPARMILVPGMASTSAATLDPHFGQNCRCT